MAKRKRTDLGENVGEVVTSSAPIQELDTLPGETHGLAVTSPPLVGDQLPPVIEPQRFEEAVAADDQPVEASVVSGEISDDPNASVGSCLLALGRLHNDGAAVSAALSKWLRTTAGEPELHAFLMRMQSLLGEFHHSFEQIDQGISDQLRDAINDALAA